MGDVPSPLAESPPLPPKPNLPMLYYGLVVIGTAALVLAIYNLLIIRWCAQSHSRTPHGPNQLVEISAAGQSCGNPSRNLLSSFKYKKEGAAAEEQGGDYWECAVCLSVFEEGEELRKLPRCKHSFHAPCIDMWLYSHPDCPLCRAPVGWRCQRHAVYTQQANSQEGLLDSDSSVWWISLWTKQRKIPSPLLVGRGTLITAGMVDLLGRRTNREEIGSRLQVAGDGVRFLSLSVRGLS